MLNARDRGTDGKRPDHVPLRTEFLAGGGRMGALIRSTDWSKSKLGPIESWPRSLRTMLGVVLGSRFPMVLWWGPELLHLYNDAYVPILRDKHPASLGAPMAEIWAEVWDVAGPMVQGVLDGGPATWTEDLQLFTKNGEMSEETYYTFSYSPVPGDDGRIAGVLNTVQETTVKVQGERQIRMLRELSARAADARSEADAFKALIEVLDGNDLDLPFALLYAREEEGDTARLAGACGLEDYEGPAKPARVSLSGAGAAAPWPLAEAFRTSREVMVEGLAERVGPLPLGRWNARPDSAIVLPLSPPGRAAPSAFLVAGVSPHRALDDRYRRFFRSTADQAITVLASARAYEAERKRAESLAELDRAKTLFFSNVSHELRTPLTLILGPLEEMLARPDATVEVEALRPVHRNALRLLKLVNSLLDFARIEAGRLQAAFEATDLAALTASLASQFRSLVESAGLELVVDCEPLGEPVFVDRGMWEKVVLNLLSNAFKFTLRGRIVVSLKRSGEHAELTVRDTGVGIPRQEVPRIFERFHRVQGAGGRSFEGTGIGLALVRELVKQHEGAVSVESVPGSGSTFTVRIPFRSTRAAAPSTGQRPLASTASGAAPFVLEASQWLSGDGAAGIAPDEEDAGRAAGPVQKHAKVLVVDDNADMRRYMAGLLAPYCQVDTAADGQAALETIGAGRIDLVVSDVMMPRLGGIELLRRLRSDPKTRTLPVVLVSARAGEESSVEGLREGADDYIVKPFSARELVARVRTHLDLAALRRQWAAELERTNAELAAAKNAAEASAKELEAFSYSVAHDLRAPLRTIDGFSELLLRRYHASLDEDGKRFLRLIRAGSVSMGRLIDDLLKLSRVTRTAMTRGRVDLSAMADKCASELRAGDPRRRVEFVIQPGLAADADAGLIRVVLGNLLDNAWKYSSKKHDARIEFGAVDREGEREYYVRDNGAGFDMRFVGNLFKPFSRLHGAAEFEGTGIGLATVQRVIERHGGRVWGEGVVGQGAAFWFTLPARATDAGR